MQLTDLPSSFSATSKGKPVHTSWLSSPSPAMASLLFLPKTCPLLEGASAQDHQVIWKISQSAQSSEWNESLPHLISHETLGTQSAICLIYWGFFMGLSFHIHIEIPLQKSQICTRNSNKNRGTDFKIFASHHRLRELTYGWARGEGLVGGRVRKLGLTCTY